jgi:hypothetical protein
MVEGAFEERGVGEGEENAIRARIKRAAEREWCAQIAPAHG